AVVLTHAHVDHSGYLPALYRRGYRGPVYCSHGTRDLCRVLLPDAGFLQEEDARYANLRKFSRHQSAEPLFTEEDARHVLQQLRPLAVHADHDIVKGVSVRLVPSGHIIGANSVVLDDGVRRLVFSGDLGRADDPVMFPPEHPGRADYLVVESTYGDRRHAPIDPEEEIRQIVTRTIGRGGIVLIPAFAVGRAQLILHILQRLRARGAIPAVPVYLNSPMAIRATEIFHEHHREHRLSHEDCEAIDAGTICVRTVEESLELSRGHYPCVIISASGMASGGRVLHHLKGLAPDHRNSVVFVGFQAPGTRGAAMVGGAERIKIHGDWIPVRAEVHALEALSAHADAEELMAWMRRFETPPRRTFVTHGEAVAADTLRLRIRDELGWRACVPEYREEFALD
ncbi:MAG: MBL fold metallo-hydrolase RNA specificity domain-containing protein, partial [Gammaproteobacteria bacterium]